MVRTPLGRNPVTIWNYILFSVLAHFVFVKLPSIELGKGSSHVHICLHLWCTRNGNYLCIIAIIFGPLLA